LERDYNCKIMIDQNKNEKKENAKWTWAYEV
jgi:hypothetical protein